MAASPPRPPLGNIPIDSTNVSAPMQWTVHPPATAAATVAKSSTHNQCDQLNDRPSSREAVELSDPPSSREADSQPKRQKTWIELRFEKYDKILNYERCMAGGLCRYDEETKRNIYTGVSLISSMEMDDWTRLSPWSDCSCSSALEHDSVLQFIFHKKQEEKRERARDRKRRIVEAHMEEEYRLKSLTSRRNLFVEDPMLKMEIIIPNHYAKHIVNNNN
eukprot:scaffold89403_cov79-Cyclotella_meneghiniana.AAC.1